MNVAGTPQHVGLLCDFNSKHYIAPDFYILHLWQPAMQVIRLPIRHLKPLGLQVEGYYGWSHQKTSVEAEQ